MTTETDAIEYQRDFTREQEECYSNKMTLEKNEKIGALEKHRYERNLKLVNDMKNDYEKQKEDLKDNRAKVKAEFVGMQELQGLIDQENKYKQEIEEMHVKLAFLAIQVTMLEDGTNMLTEKKELLDEQKKRQDEANEELAKQLTAKEEANQKRLIAKLARDKNPKVKELQQAEEDQTQANEEFNHKFRTEFEKHNSLLNELLQVRENLRLTKEKFEETTKLTEAEQVELNELQLLINKKQADADAKQRIVAEARKTNEFESEKNKKFMKANAALKAKLNFIEEKYDYSSSAKQMSIEDFRQIIESNLSVNKTIGGFTGKLDQIQKELQQLDAMRQF